MKDKLKINYLEIYKPPEWNDNRVTIEIHNYDYDSTTLSIDELKILKEYISEIIYDYDQKHNIN